MDKKTAEKIIKLTKKTYDQIAGKFSQTRQRIWSDIRFCKHYIKDKQKILDLGCGNGRLIQLFKSKNIEYLGVDYSKKLIKIARKEYPEYDFEVGDVLDLDFEKDAFDVVFSIATLHHIPSTRFRKKAVREMRRVVKEDGLVIISVWNLENKSWAQEEQNLSDFNLGPKDLLKTWNNNPNLLRYFYKFSLDELKDLIKREGLEVVEVKESDHNLVVVAKPT